MAKAMQWIKAHLPTQRRLIQLYAALLYNAHIKGFLKGSIYTGSLKILCVPGLNCYSCPGAIGACPLGALQNAVASSGSRTPTYIVGILLLYGLILGRTICGYLCPIGLIQEILHKIPTPKIKKNRLTRICSYIKYVILILFVVLIPLCYMLKEIPVPAFCKYICPAGTFEGAIGLLAHPVHEDKLPMLGFLFTQKFVVMVIIAAASVFLYRAFCRFLCPLGAIYGLFSRVAVIGVKVNIPRCVDCGQCVRCCPMDVQHVGDHECIHCGACINACPTSAISFKAGKYTICSRSGGESEHNLHQSKCVRRWLLYIAAGILLIGLVFRLNTEVSQSDILIPSDNLTETGLMTDNDLPAGCEVGMLAPDFTISTYGGGNTFSLHEQRGKTVILNFWATWCAPCVKELPHFEEIQRRYQNSVQVVCIHSSLVTDDVESYLARHDYELTFALDKDNTVIPAYGGSLMLPQTVIIDASGVIVYNAVGSLTLEALEQLLDVIPGQ